MGESQHKQKRPQNKLMQGGMKGPGKIVEVQGGRILRSTGGKDRHSKVFTFKGPRDRRVRLSAHTAIQFYDVQDRLGYDRPSKAVDWLINKAKAAIDELAELPTQNSHPPLAESSKRELQSSEDLSSSPFGFPSNGLPTLDSDALADTIKSFFPISTSPAIGFQREEDLRLSLHSFQDPILLPGHSSANYDAGSSNWAEQNQRMTPWNMAGDAAPLHPLPSQSSYFSQRGPLQYSFPANARSWADAFSAVEQQSYAGTAFGGFSGFLIPARIQEEDDHGGVADPRTGIRSRVLP